MREGPVEGEVRAPSEALKPGTRVGAYRILRFIGRGGFGITYEGMHAELGRRVAIKEFFLFGAHMRDGEALYLAPAAEQDGISPEVVADLLGRFVDEARKIATRFDHPGIVKGENFLSQNNTAYLIMSFIDGEPYSAVLRRMAGQGRVPDEAALRAVFDPVLDAVEYLHDRDELHRDLKPANLMIRAGGAPIVIDFGTSRSGLNRSSVTSTAFQSAGFSPPEQIAQDDDVALGPPADIYALGATLYRSLAGRVPARAEARLASLRPGGFGRDIYVPLTDAMPEAAEARPEFLAAIDRALSLDPRDRQQSIRELRHDLGWDRPAIPADSTAAIPFSAAPPPAPSPSRGRITKVVAALAGAGLLGAVVAMAPGALDRWRDHERLTAAGFQESELATLSTEAGTSSIRAEARRRLAVLTAERQDLAAAGEDLGRLEALQAKPCEACVTAGEARTRLAAAQAKRGRILLLGPDGGPVDQPEAVRLLRAAAAAGHADGQATLGFALERGLGTARDEAGAVAAYRAAVDQGHVDALNNLGNAYRRGIGGLPRDDTEAVRLYRKAAALDNGRGIANLGSAYELGIGGITKDEARAVALYRQSAGLGNSVGQTSLGNAHRLGLGGLPRNEQEAVRLFRLAADQGHEVGLYRLGYAYENGEGGLERDRREAVRLYALAARQGNPIALNALGLANENGTGGLVVDAAEAVRLYRQAADLGNTFGVLNLGFAYERGFGGLPKDEAEAVRLYRSAADRGNARARSTLGSAHERGIGGLARNPALAVQYYRQSADAGDESGQTNLGNAYERGIGGLAKDEAQAVKLYRLAADKGYARAAADLGSAYERGIGGLAKDEAEAVRLYRRAAESGFARARAALASAYERGIGGLQRDEDEAVRLYRLAAQGGNRQAARALERLNLAVAAPPVADEAQAP